ncbi:hypothetical protein CBG25_09460 [Arsenophonus sp. ENCA]|uniref:Uncharacterized protein n=1 Tax=Arsenophonus nasoniae TaxID=638 RepID=D2U3S7_9GAMM|nr:MULTISPECIES: hypothetical protein [Arsenophonus]PAV02678.1 hypothetical protein CBG25_09460 [Arsenophonus sp. ENCA]WGM13841.1 hypothetical protein QE197_25365 [Arsenophonus nasoniae]CBA76068.1 hypothetical protein ARN_33170 [Arsenophonus nasoniae]
MSRSDRITKGVTRVVEKRNITTGKQMNLRMTNLDEDALSIMIDKIQEIVPQKNISKSRVLRAVGYLNYDMNLVKKLAKSVINNT